MALSSILSILVLFQVVHSSSEFSIDDQGFIIDSYGRKRIFHGVNAVYKQPPYLPVQDSFDSNYSLSVQDFISLQSWGLNVIRLGVMWVAVEPEKGLFNQTFLADVVRLVRTAKEYGIYIIIDAHNDVYSRKFCGEGFPDWAVETRNFPLPVRLNIARDASGLPDYQDCLKSDFSIYYYTFDSVEFEDHFLDNKKGLLDLYQRFWVKMALTFKDESNVLGYDILNEPIGKTYYKRPISFLRRKIKNDELLEAYQQLYPSVRSVDPSTLFLFAPSFFTQSTKPYKDSPGGYKNRHTQIFTFHGYCFHGKTNQECTDQVSARIKQFKHNTKKLGVGMFSAETAPFTYTNISSGAYAMTDLYSSLFMSWAHWQYKYYKDITTGPNGQFTQGFYDINGNLFFDKVKALARPYAYAICGTPIKEQLVDPLGMTIYLLSWNPSTCGIKATEIFLNEPLYFANGFTIEWKNCSGCTIQPIAGFPQGYYSLAVGSATGTVTFSVTKT